MRATAISPCGCPLEPRTLYFNGGTEPSEKTLCNGTLLRDLKKPYSLSCYLIIQYAKDHKRGSI